MAVGTTRGKRRLGRYLRPIVERAGMNGKQVAERARCSPATVTRLLNGDNLPRIHLFLMILQVIEATPQETEKAIQLWEIADADGAAIAHADDLPVYYRRFRMDEREAATERTLDTTTVSGLLQTADYAVASIEPFRPLMKGTWNAEAQVDERRDRQSLLHRAKNPLALHALIDESALRRVVGGAAVMAAQLDHLVTTATLSNVTIQAIPYGAGSYGVVGSPMIIMGFPEDDEPDAVFVESVLGTHKVENVKDVAALSAVWDGAARLALSPRETTKLIRKLKGHLNADH